MVEFSTTQLLGGILAVLIFIAGVIFYEVVSIEYAKAKLVEIATNAGNSLPLSSAQTHASLGDCLTDIRTSYQQCRAEFPNG